MHIHTNLEDHGTECYNTHMPSKRNTHGLNACTDYSIRVCGETPCEYHQAIDEAKSRGISLANYMKYLEAQKDEQQEENK